MSSGLPIVADEKQVELAHFLIAHRGAGLLPAAQVVLGFELSPRSFGRDLLDFGYLHRKLREPDPFAAYGECESYAFNDVERRVYRLLAHQAESALRASGVVFGKAMKLRMAGAALQELVEQPVCPHCNSAGCKRCGGFGKVPMTKTRRIHMLETNHANWVKHLGGVYTDVFLPMVAQQEREAARVWLRTMWTHFEDRMREVLYTVEQVAA